MSYGWTIWVSLPLDWAPLQAHVALHPDRCIAMIVASRIVFVGRSIGAVSSEGGWRMHGGVTCVWEVRVPGL